MVIGMEIEFCENSLDEFVKRVAEDMRKSYIDNYESVVGKIKIGDEVVGIIKVVVERV